MKLHDYIEQIEEGLFDNVEGDLNKRLNATNAIRNLITWAEHANELLITVEAVYSERLTNPILREISSAIDTEI